MHCKTVDKSPIREIRLNQTRNITVTVGSEKSSKKAPKRGFSRDIYTCYITTH